jgi:methyl-accepting chemotaxis protein
MFSRLAIRTKISIVICFFLVALAGLGLLAVRKMQGINADAMEIGSNWLPSIRVLGALRATTIDYRNLIRAHILAETAEQLAATDKGMDVITTRVLEQRKEYEQLISSADERSAYGAWVKEWDILSQPKPGDPGAGPQECRQGIARSA